MSGIEPPALPGPFHGNTVFQFLLMPFLRSTELQVLLSFAEIQCTPYRQPPGLSRIRVFNFKSSPVHPSTVLREIKYDKMDFGRHGAQLWYMKRELGEFLEKAPWWNEWLFRLTSYIGPWIGICIFSVGI